MRRRHRRRLTDRTSDVLLRECQQCKSNRNWLIVFLLLYPSRRMSLQQSRTAPIFAVHCVVLLLISMPGKFFAIRVFSRCTVKYKYSFIHLYGCYLIFISVVINQNRVSNRFYILTISKKKKNFSEIVF